MFGVKRHELSVSTYQMALLVQFNTASTLTARELITLTQIPVTQLNPYFRKIFCFDWFVVFVGA